MIYLQCKLTRIRSPKIYVTMINYHSCYFNLQEKPRAQHHNICSMSAEYITKLEDPSQTDAT